MKKVLVLGATGFVGKHLVEKLVDRGHNVRILVRDSSKASDLAQLHNVEVIQGAYFDKPRLKEVVTDMDVVITTIAPKPLSKVSNDDMSQYKASFAELIHVLEMLKIDRFVHIAGSTIRFKGEKLSLRRKGLRLVLSIAARPALRLKDFELQVMVQSNLNWVSIRSPMIREEITGSLVADEHKMPGGEVDVNQLAEFMVDQLDKDKWVRKAPFVATK